MQYDVNWRSGETVMVRVRTDKYGAILCLGEGQRKDGRYYYQFKLPRGKRRVIYARTLEKLREEERKLNVRLGIEIDADWIFDITLNEAFDLYIELKPNLKKQTRFGYINTYDRYVREGLGKKKIFGINNLEIKRFYLSLHGKNGKEVNINIVEAVDTILHPVFTMAVRNLWITTNPADGVAAEIKKGRKQKKNKCNFLTREQQRAFLEFTATNPVYKNWLPLFVFLFGTGCRIGEAIGLRWEDLDFDNGFICIDHELEYRQMEDKKCKWFVSTTKSEAGDRMIPMLDKVKDILLEEYEWQKQHGFVKRTVDGMSGFVFQNTQGGLVHPRSANNAIRRICEAYNCNESLKAAQEGRTALLIPYFTCHWCRRTFATRLYECNVDWKTAQILTGHTDINTLLNIYVKASKEKLRENIKCMEMDIF